MVQTHTDRRTQGRKHAPEIVELHFYTCNVTKLYVRIHNKYQSCDSDKSRRMDVLTYTD